MRTIKITLEDERGELSRTYAYDESPHELDWSAIAEDMVETLDNAHVEFATKHPEAIS